MGDRFIHNLASTYRSYSNKGTHVSSRPFLPELRNSGVVSGTPLSSSHAGDKGDFDPPVGKKNALGLVWGVDKGASLASGDSSSIAYSGVNSSSQYDAALTIAGQRPVDVVCVTAALCKEEGKAAVSEPSKKGKLYFKLMVVAAVYAYSAIASASIATPVIVNNNGTLNANACAEVVNKKYQLESPEFIPYVKFKERFI